MLRNPPSGWNWPLPGTAMTLIDHGGAKLPRARVGVEQAGAVGGRMAAAARHEGAVDDDGLALDVPAEEVGAAPMPTQTASAVMPCGAPWCRRPGTRSRGRSCCPWMTCSSAPSSVGRQSSRQHVGESLDLEAEPLELVGHVLHAGAVGRRCRGSGPTMLVDGVAIAERDIGQGDDVPLHACAVDILVGLLSGLEREDRIVRIREQLRGVAARQPDAVGLLGLRPVVHLRQRDGGGQRRGREDAQSKHGAHG